MEIRLNTSVYAGGAGIVVDEPSTVALDARLGQQNRLEWGSMPWNKVIRWVILLVIGVMAYMTYLQLAPMD